jgi:hypothetical protein
MTTATTQTPDRAPDTPRGTDRGPSTAALWPPERMAAVRLARARDTLARTPAGDAPGRALAHRQLDVAEAAARDHLARPPAPTDRPDEQAATERGREALAGMLDPNPVTREAATNDATVVWPAEHLRVLQDYAEHAHSPGEEAAADDAIARARAAVDAIPDTDQAADSAESLLLTDADVFAAGDDVIHVDEADVLERAEP